MWSLSAKKSRQGCALGGPQKSSAPAFFSRRDLEHQQHRHRHRPHTYHYLTQTQKPPASPTHLHRHVRPLPIPRVSHQLTLHTSMHLMFIPDPTNPSKRIYTLKKVIDGEVSKSAHPARFSPDDKYSRHRVTIKKRYGLLLTQQSKSHLYGEGREGLGGLWKRL